MADVPASTGLAILDKDHAVIMPIVAL